ncbi:DUF1345 domain-containing protein [Mastigocladus laminosus UU774]|nr:DUF1345 domain-containing protein [Mastigocladus laminosus UU774]
MLSFTIEVRILSTWSAGVLWFVALTWFMMFNTTPGKVLDRAQHQEADHLAVFLLVIFIAFRKLFAIAVVLAKHKDSFTLSVGLSIVAIFSFWVLMHTMLTLHYANDLVLGDRFTTKLPGLWAGTISGFIMIATGIYEYFVI